MNKYSSQEPPGQSPQSWYNYTFLKGIKVCSNEEPRPGLSLRGDNNEILKIH